MKKTIILLLVMLCGQMCRNHTHNSIMNEMISNGSDSSSIEKVFVSDRLQDSLEYFIISKDISDFDVITLSCFQKGKDTIVHIAACDYIYGFVDYESRLVYHNEANAGAFTSNGMIYALNYIGDFPFASIFDTLFTNKLDMLMYAHINDDRYYEDYAIPYVMSLAINGDSLRTIYTNIRDRNHLNTLRGYNRVDR